MRAVKALSVSGAIVLSSFFVGCFPHHGDDDGGCAAPAGRPGCDQ